MRRRDSSPLAAGVREVFSACRQAVGSACLGLLEDGLGEGWRATTTDPSDVGARPLAYSRGVVRLLAWCMGGCCDATAAEALAGTARDEGWWASAVEGLEHLAVLDGGAALEPEVRAWIARGVRGEGAPVRALRLAVMEARRALCEVLETPALGVLESVWAQLFGAVYGSWMVEGGPVTSRQRTRGVFYTPPALAASLTEDLCEVMAQAWSQDDAVERPRVCDPACGGGGLLVSVTAALVAAEMHRAGRPPNAWTQEVMTYARHSVFGMDIDPLAVECTALALWLLARAPRPHGVQTWPGLAVADALIGDDIDRDDVPETDVPPRHWQDRFPEVFGRGRATKAGARAGGFDLVVANPPFVDSESMTRRAPETRASIASAFSTARGNWDLYVPFVELACQLLRPGGIAALVLPKTALAARYAAPMHGRLFAERMHRLRAFGDERFFVGASVEVVTATVQRGAAVEGHMVEFVTGLTDSRVDEVTQMSLAGLPPGFICLPFSGETKGHVRALELPNRLGDLCTLGDGATTREAYELVELVHAQTEDGPGGRTQQLVRLVNTGTVDPFRLLWATRAIRYLGKKLARPVLSLAQLEARFPRRAAQAMRWGVIVAGLSRRLEAAVSPPGVLCGKSAVLLTPAEDICPYALAAWLNAGPVTALYRGLFSFGGFGGDTLSVAPGQLRHVPVPAPGWFSRATPPVAEAAHGVESSAPDVANADTCLLSYLGRALSSEDLDADALAGHREHLDRHVHRLIASSSAP